MEKVEEALSIIRSIPEAIDIQIDGNKIITELAYTDEQLCNLMDRLRGAGVRMTSFAEKEPTLEDVFMLVTKGLVT